MIDYRKGLRITNFTATQSLSVTIRNLSELDNVMDAVISTGANRIDGVEYQSSELRKYKDQARDEAAKAAKEKALALALALGTRSGRPTRSKRCSSGRGPQWQDWPTLPWNKRGRPPRRPRRGN
jgi:uncharacterized protein YggE